MFKGLLEVSGTIDLNQFWPIGESDADTVKVLLSGPEAFTFRSDPDSEPRVTHAFDGAVIKGKTNTPAIKAEHVTIRLQGIDAPELHYRPTAPTINKIKPTPEQRAAFNKVNKNFRQKFGETAPVELKNHLGKAGHSPLRCVIRTAVDHPRDVFDTFGRLIGDVIITENGKELNTNLWLCERGWAFPTFYASMISWRLDGPRQRNAISTNSSAKAASSRLPRKISFLTNCPRGSWGPTGSRCTGRLFGVSHASGQS